MLTLARLELRRFLRARLTRAALAGLTLIPLLYGALYLWAFWDPYDQMKHIPAAIVNEDRPVTVDGKKKEAGKDLQQKLIDKETFAWQVTGREAALKGLDSGRYHIVLVVPENFSASVSSPSVKDKDPYRGQLQVLTNDSNNYLSGVLARSAFTEIRAQANSGAAKEYFDRIFVSFADVKSALGKAANGANELNGGIGTATDGAGKLKNGSGDLKNGTGELSGGLGTAHAKAQELNNGLITIKTGSGQLEDASARLAAGTRLLATKLSGAADQVEPYLQYADEVAAAATAIADGTDLAIKGMDALPGLVNTSVQQAEQVHAGLVKLGESQPALKSEPLYISALDASSKSVEAARAVREKVNANPGAFAELKAQMQQVSAKARALAAKAPKLPGEVAKARTDANALAEGAEKVAAGAKNLHSGIGKAQSGMDALTGGLYRLSTGARQIDSGMLQLDSGLSDLSGGLVKLHDGSAELATKLGQGEAEIPGYDADQRAQRSTVMGDPIDVQRQAKNAAATYGVGFSPYFIALALWVGAMLTYMLLRPVNPRHLASGAPAWRVALAGWLPGLAVGIIQAAVLLAVLHFALGLDLVRPWAAIGVLGLTVAAFTALLQLIGAKFGAAGRVLALMLLMVQLTSSAGTYPIETSPAFLRALHPYMPMTYVIRALRHLITGGATGPVWQAVAVLAGVTAGAVGLTVLVLRKSRRLTPSKLNPDLQM
ncbi:YhgE/Pip family protein [Longispora albida]|uniref:YhgE/Pip family protein n=1 Tax=Longispora albida TaxID=203523 RepID=UPI000363E653|nr:YhgE/Pip domain-containing protein [Longispora albida]